MSGGRFDNTITYKSPEFGGVNLYGQMSLKQDAKEDGKETSSEVNRYYAVGMTGRFGAAGVGATFAITDYANTEYSELAEDNGYALTGYYRHNLGEITPVIAVQWFDHAKQSRFDDDGKPVTLVSETAGADGFGVVGGATMEIGGGTAMMQVGYRRAEYSTPMFAIIRLGTQFKLQLVMNIHFLSAPRFMVVQATHGKNNMVCGPATIELLR